MIDAIVKSLEYFQKKFEDSINLLIKSKSNVFYRNTVISSVEQNTLVAQWILMRENDYIFSDFNSVGFRNYSQNNEDGIILYIFTVIGTVNKLFVEIGANCEGSSVGIPENNTTNLVVNFGWNGLILDGNKSNVGQLIHFFASSNDTKHFHWKRRNTIKNWESNYYCPVIRQEVVDPDNINNIIQESYLSGEVDLLSIDVDGDDYKLWKSINVISPRVVVIEFNNKIDFKSKYVSSSSDSLKTSEFTDEDWLRAGCSLGALVSLGKEKGYRLIGVNSTAFNAFFMRNDVGLKEFAEISIEDIEGLPIFYILNKEDRLNIDEHNAE